MRGIKTLSITLTTAVCLTMRIRPSSALATPQVTQRSALFQRPMGAGSPTSTRLDVAASGVLASLDTFWKAYPYAAAGITCGLKASMADWVAQKRQYKKRVVALVEEEDLKTEEAKEVLIDEKSTDKKRNAGYILYGILYQGLMMEFFYSRLYPSWFGVGTDFATVARILAFDLLVQATVLTLPLAYLSKAVLYRYSPREAMRRYWEDVRDNGLLKKYMSVWAPVQCMTFTIVPQHWRVTFVACVSFFWMILLSSVLSKGDSGDADSKTDRSCRLVDGSTCNIDG